MYWYIYKRDCSRTIHEFIIEHIYKSLIEFISIHESLIKHVHEF